MNKMLILLIVLIGVLDSTSVEASNDHSFIFNQIMNNCLGQQYVNRATQRQINAIRRCEQAAPVPLRDQALERIIAELQPGSSRVIYVPVPTPFGFGGTFPLGSNNLNNFNQFGGGSNLGGSGFSSTGFGATGTNNFGTSDSLNPDPFNPNLSNLGFRPDSTQNTNFGLRPNSNRRPATSTNNPFGFNFGKQTSGAEEPVDIETEEDKTMGEGEAKSRSRRQLPPLSTHQLQQVKLEALHHLSNMTCVLRAANYIDHNNLPNYQFFENELRSLQLSRDLRNDMASGLIFCKELTQCMPIERLNHPLARELGQAITYFRCIARTNVKACKKEDERRTQSNVRLTGAFFNGNGMDLLRSVEELALDDDSLGYEFF